MWLEKFPVHFLYKIKVSEVFSFLIRNSRVFFKFFGGRNKEANDKMISFCRARRILHPQGYVAIFNFQEKRVSSPNHLFKYILLDLQQNFYWTAIRFLDPRAACTRTAWLVDLPFFVPGNNRLPRNACQEGNSKIFKTFINLLRRAVKNSYSYCSTTRPVEAIFLLLDVENSSTRRPLENVYWTSTSQKYTGQLMLDVPIPLLGKERGEEVLRQLSTTLWMFKIQGKKGNRHVLRARFAYRSGK